MGSELQPASSVYQCISVYAAARKLVMLPRIAGVVVGSPMTPTQTMLPMVVSVMPVSVHSSVMTCGGEVGGL